VVGVTIGGSFEEQLQYLQRGTAVSTAYYVEMDPQQRISCSRAPPSAGTLCGSFRRCVVPSPNLKLPNGHCRKSVGGSARAG